MARAFLFLHLALCLAARPVGAAGQTPAKMLEGAARSFSQGDFEESAAVLRALAPRGPEFRRAWQGFLFERQGYAQLERELSIPELKDLDDRERGLLARCRADLGDWRGCLAALDGLDSASALALRAESLDELCDPGAAAAWTLALSAMECQADLPLASFKAGDYFFRLGMLAEAEAALKKTKKLDSAWTATNPLLTSLYLREGRVREAFRGLEAMRGVDPSDQAVRDGLNQLVLEHPELLEEARAGERRADAARAARKNPRVRAMRRRPKEPMVRVGLLVRAPGFRFKTACPVAVEPLGLTLPADCAFEATQWNGAWKLSALDVMGSTPQAIAVDQDLVLHPLDAQATLSVYDVAFGSGYFWAAKEDRAYRGDLELHPEGLKGLTVVDRLPLESYLLGVLPSEIRPAWPMEALKAQAITARADLLSRLGRHKASGFDVCADVHCAAYRGAGAEHPRCSAAVTGTAGLVLVSKKSGRPMQVNYMDSCGGHTEDVGEVWGKGLGSAVLGSNAVYDGPLGKKNDWPNRFPLDPAALIDYLDYGRAQVPAWCDQPGRESLAQFRWVARYEAAGLEKLVSRRLDVGHLLAVEPLERSPSGYVKRVRFTGSKGVATASSDSIRTAIKGLRSNLFYVETRRDPQGRPAEFLFHGGGWGHGCGFCQTGAYGMARSGNGYKQILRHYFRSAKISRRY